VQTRFAGEPEYVAAYTAERDLLFRAAAALSRAEAQRLAAEALGMMRARHSRWFTGEAAIFAGLDDVFLALEGVGQWAGYAWLAHPEGGGVAREEAIRMMLGRRKWWVQDHGLALFLAIDRLLPTWPALEFHGPALGASELLTRAVAASLAPRVTELPVVGSPPTEETPFDGLLAIAPSRLDRMYRIEFQAAAFEVAVDSRGLVSYLSTSAASFSTPEGIQTGSPWSAALAAAGAAGAGPIREPGWACHVRLPSGWHAAARLTGPGMDRCQGEVAWLFQRH
jgi:hypothetical protein